MALTDTKLQRWQAKERTYQLADGSGLYVEVQPTGKKVWRMLYRLGGRGQGGPVGACYGFSRRL